MTKEQDKKVMADSVFTMVEDTLDTPVRLEIITTRAEEMPQMMLHSVPSDPVVRQYKCGDYIGKHDWELYLRIGLGDTSQRIEAVEALSAAAGLIEKAVPEMPQGFEYIKTRTTLTPGLNDATDSFETYLVTFSTEFKRLIERS